VSATGEHDRLDVCSVAPHVKVACEVLDELLAVKSGTFSSFSPEVMPVPGAVERGVRVGEALIHGPLGRQLRDDSAPPDRSSRRCICRWRPGAARRCPARAADLLESCRRADRHFPGRIARRSRLRREAVEAHTFADGTPWPMGWVIGLAGIGSLLCTGLMCQLRAAL
jgi:hypothetical protein